MKFVKTHQYHGHHPAGTLYVYAYGRLVGPPHAPGEKFNVIFNVKNCLLRRTMLIDIEAAQYYAKHKKFPANVTKDVFLWTPLER